MEWWLRNRLAWSPDKNPSDRRRRIDTRRFLVFMALSFQSVADVGSRRSATLMAVWLERVTSADIRPSAPPLPLVTSFGDSLANKRLWSTRNLVCVLSWPGPGVESSLERACFGAFHSTKKYDENIHYFRFNYWIFFKALTKYFVRTQ